MELVTCVLPIYNLNFEHNMPLKGWILLAVIVFAVIHRSCYQGSFAQLRCYGCAFFCSFCSFLIKSHGGRWEGSHHLGRIKHERSIL
jgi:hypothetical protein